MEIYVLSNGFHSDIALPLEGGETLRALGLSGQDYPVDMDRAEYLAFGWGSRTAYASLLEVSDLSVPMVLRALAFDRTVMHVQPLGALAEEEGIFRVRLSRGQYRRLRDFIAGSFRREEGGSAVALPGLSHGFGDRFYPGRGRFSPFSTCNSWTGRALREAGVGLGLWTPLAGALEIGLRRRQAGADLPSSAG